MLNFKPQTAFIATKGFEFIYNQQVNFVVTIPLYFFRILTPTINKLVL